MKITSKSAPAALAIALTALVPAPGRAADHPGTSHTDQDASPLIETVETLCDEPEADRALVTDCLGWKAICYANRVNIYDAWMEDCRWTEILCNLGCFATCMTPSGLDVACFWPCLGDCAIDTTECRSAALEFLEDCRDACYEARDCASRATDLLPNRVGTPKAE